MDTLTDAQPIPSSLDSDYKVVFSCYKHVDGMKVYKEMVVGRADTYQDALRVANASFGVAIFTANALENLSINELEAANRVHNRIRVMIRGPTSEEKVLTPSVRFD